MTIKHIFMLSCLYSSHTFATKFQVPPLKIPINDQPAFVSFQNQLSPRTQTVQAARDAFVKKIKQDSDSESDNSLSFSNSPRTPKHTPRTFEQEAELYDDLSDLFLETIAQCEHKSGSWRRRNKLPFELIALHHHTPQIQLAILAQIRDERKRYVQRCKNELAQLELEDTLASLTHTCSNQSPNDSFDSQTCAETLVSSKSFHVPSNNSSTRTNPFENW